MGLDDAFTVCTQVKFPSVHILSVLRDWSLICLTMMSLDICYEEFCYSPKMECSSPLAFHQLKRMCDSKNYPYLQQGWLFSLYPSPPGISNLASYFPFVYWDPPPPPPRNFPWLPLVRVWIFSRCPPKGGGNHYKRLYGEALHEWGTFFRLLVHMKG